MKGSILLKAFFTSLVCVDLCLIAGLNVFFAFAVALIRYGIIKIHLRCCRAGFSSSWQPTDVDLRQSDKRDSAVDGPAWPLPPLMPPAQSPSHTQEPAVAPTPTKLLDTPHHPLQTTRLVQICFCCPCVVLVLLWSFGLLKGSPFCSPDQNWKNIWQAAASLLTHML